MIKKVIFVLIISSLTSLSAQELMVYVREGKKLKTKKVSYQEVGLKPGAACFENEYIQVIDGKTEVEFNPITLTDQEECSDGIVKTGIESDRYQINDKKKITLKTRAATVMYHLKIAREFLLNKMNDYQLSINLDEKIVVRLNMSGSFHQDDHFRINPPSEGTNENRVPIVGALSISKSIAKMGNFRAAHVKPWRHEIWFYRPVEKKLKSALAMVGDELDNPYVKGSLSRQFLLNDIISATSGYSQLVGANRSPDKFFYQYHGINALISLFTPQAIPKIFKGLGKMFKRNVYLDVGLLPEVIYHEYAHYAFRESLPPDSSAIQEGFANYFAYMVSNLHTHGANSKGMVKGIAAKKPKTNDLYTYDVDHKDVEKTLEKATGNFFYAIMYEYKKNISKKYPELFDYLMLRLVSKPEHRSYYLHQTIKIKPFSDRFVTSINDLAKKKSYYTRKIDYMTGNESTKLFNQEEADILIDIIYSVNAKYGF